MPTEIVHISFVEYKADSKAIIDMTMIDQMYLIFFFKFFSISLTEKSPRQLQMRHFWPYFAKLN